MEVTILRQKLHSLIDTSSEEKLDEIYDLLNEDEYSDDFKAMLDNEFEQYQKDGEVISRTEIDKLMNKLPGSK